MSVIKTILYNMERGKPIHHRGGLEVLLRRVGAILMYEQKSGIILFLMTFSFLHNQEDTMKYKINKAKIFNKNDKPIAPFPQIYHYFCSGSVHFIDFILVVLFISVPTDITNTEIVVFIYDHLSLCQILLYVQLFWKYEVLIKIIDVSQFNHYFQICINNYLVVCISLFRY